MCWDRWTVGFLSLVFSFVFSLFSSSLFSFLFSLLPSLFSFLSPPFSFFLPSLSATSLFMYCKMYLSLLLLSSCIARCNIHVLFLLPPSHSPHPLFLLPSSLFATPALSLNLLPPPPLIMPPPFPLYPSYLATGCYGASDAGVGTSDVRSLRNRGV